MERISRRSFLKGVGTVDDDRRFSPDPVYGGNKDMIGWKLIGFPVAYANYYEFVDQHGIAFNRAPISLAQDARGMVHVHPVSVHSPPKGGQ